MSTMLHDFFIVYLIIYIYIHIIISCILIFVHRDMPLPLMTIIHNRSKYLEHSHGSWVLWAPGIPEDRRICHRHVLKVRMSQKWKGRWREMCFFPLGGSYGNVKMAFWAAVVGVAVACVFVGYVRRCCSPWCFCWLRSTVTSHSRFATKGSSRPHT